MAERRMFSKKITNSDLFLDMPMSAQALYFHLNMNADDDGFLNNPKSVMRFIGAKEDDFKLLIVKGFVIPFENGIVVIKHWKVHNYIQKDRYKKTDYQEEFSRLDLVNNEYQLKPSETPILDNVSVLDTECIQSVSIGKDRIGKDRLELGKDINTICSPEGSQGVVLDEKETMFEEFWKLYPKKSAKAKCKTSFMRIKNLKEEFSKIKEHLEYSKNTDQWKKSNGQFIPSPLTYINQERWKDVIEIPKSETKQMFDDISLDGWNINARL